MDESEKTAMDERVPSDYRSYYTVIFTLFYLIEGIHQGIPLIYPLLLMKYQAGTYDAAFVMFITSSTSLPWAFKFIVGLINDKWGSKRFGRRFPFIFFGGLWCAVWWLIFAGNLQSLSYNTAKVYTELLFFSIMTNIGMAVADTAIDGLILDVTPKIKLGKIQSITWTALMAGSAVGGAVLGYIFIEFDILWLLFTITGIFSLLFSILSYYIKENAVDLNVDITEDLKRLFTEKENYKVYGFTFWDSVANPIVGTIFMYFLLISVGQLDAEDTLLSLASGNLGDLFTEAIFIQIGYGIGVVLGCYIAGRVADKNRKKSVALGYIFYIPTCLVCIFFKGMILGNIANGFFGFSYGVMSISGQTVRGDIAKEHFSDLKSTYFALLISLSNAGLAFGNFIGGWIFRFLAVRIPNFDLLTFFVMIFCALTLLLSYGLFRTIKPSYYEFESVLKPEVREIIIKVDNENGSED